MLHNLSEEVNNATFDSKSEQAIFCGLDPHDYLEVKFFLISVVGTLIGIFGIFGNVSTALILTRPSMRNPNNLFLTALSVFDTCLLVTAFFIYGMEYIIEYTETFNLYVAWLTYLRFAYALSHISQTGSVYITVSVTIERYLAVCYPRRSKQLCTSHGSALSILCVTCFAVLFNCTKFFELEVIRNPVCGDGVNWQSYILTPSALSLHPIYSQVYALWLTNLVMVFLPFLTLLMLNGIIAYTIRRSLQRMKMSERFHRSQLKEKSREATVVLIIIVFIFLFCNFWGFVLTLLEQIVDYETLRVQNHAFYTFSREAINFLAIINSSINFVIYLLFGKDFRKELVVIYGCGVRGITLRLPIQDKFNAWRRQSTKNARRTSSMRSRRDRFMDRPLVAGGIRLLRRSTSVLKSPPLKYVKSEQISQHETQQTLIPSSPFGKPGIADECNCRQLPSDEQNHLLTQLTPNYESCTQCFTYPPTIITTLPTAKQIWVPTKSSLGNGTASTSPKKFAGSDSGNATATKFFPSTFPFQNGNYSSRLSRIRLPPDPRDDCTTLSYV